MSFHPLLEDGETTAARKRGTKSSSSSSSSTGKGKHVLGKELTPYQKRMVQLAVRRAWFQFFEMLAITGLLIAIVVLLAGAYASSDMMVRTSEATVSMKKATDDLQKNAQAYLKSLVEQFPEHQDRLTARQILGIIENTHKILQRVQFLLSTVQPETVTMLASNFASICSRVQIVLDNIDLNDPIVARGKALVDHVTELIAGVTPVQVNKLVDGVAETATHIGVMSKEAETNHLIVQTTHLFEELYGTLNRFNHGQQLSLGLSPSTTAIALPSK